jgi:hypothetical protein
MEMSSDSTVVQFLKYMYLEKDWSDEIKLGRMFEYLEFAIADVEYDKINSILGVIEPKRMQVMLLTGLLRCVFRIRQHLSNWDVCLIKTHMYLTSIDLDADRLLRGLDKPTVTINVIPPPPSLTSIPKPELLEYTMESFDEPMPPKPYTDRILQVPVPPPSANIYSK